MNPTSSVSELSRVPGKLRDLLGRQKGTRFLILGLLMLLSALVEVACVASFVPFGLVVANPHSVRDQAALRSLSESLQLDSESQVLGFLALTATALFVLSGLLRAITQWACSDFAWTENERLSSELLYRYSRQPYVWYLSRNTSDLTRDVVSEVPNLVEHVLRKSLILASRVLIAALVALGLLLVEPLVALSSACVLSLTYGMVYRVLRKRLRRIGQRRLELSARAQRVVSETFSAIKEAKSPGEPRDFQLQHRSLMQELRSLMVTRDVSSEMPVFIAETVAVFTILCVAGYLVVSKGDSQTAVGLSVLYLAAIVRLTPLLQLIYSDIVGIKFFLPVLDRVHQEFAQPRPPEQDSAPISFHSELRLEGVKFRYPGARNETLKGINLSVPKNGCIGLVGPTGGGKTTIADIFAGLLGPSEGRFLSDATQVTSERQTRWRAQVGYVPQEIFLFDESAWKNIALGVPEAEVDWKRLEASARTARIHQFIETELETGYQTVLGERGVTLSGGQRQRIGIARALYNDPDVLILDEATSSLDNVTERAVMETIEALGQSKTLIIVAHRLSTVRACDTIHLIGDGEIQASGSYQELSETSEAFQEMLKIGLLS